jgi:hypothetical protein
MSTFLSLKNAKYLVLTISIVAILIFTISSTNKDSNKNELHDLKYKGAVLAHIHKIGNGYGSTPSKEMHKHLNEIGYNFVQLNSFAYMFNRKQTKVYVGGDPSMAPLLRRVR